MNKFWIILSHTYMTRLKAKTFIITTLITLLFIFGIANIQPIIEFFSNDEADRVAIIDRSEQLFDPFKASVEQASEDVELELFSGTEQEAEKAVEEEEFKAYVTLDLNDNQLPKATYYAKTISESKMQSILEQQLQQLKIAMATQQAGIDEQKLNIIYEQVSFEKVALDESAKTDEELNQARGIVYIMLFLLYMSVMMYGQMIATDVATEKSSRVMEILISSASPVSHMFAKIAGIALLGLTQVAVFIIAGYGLILTKKDELVGGIFEIFGLQDTSLSVYFYAVLFFVLGYLLYATLAAMLGSLVSRVEDAQQLTMPIIFLIMIAFLIAMFGISMPASKFITITSFIPFFTPMVMFLRVGMLDIPVWEIGLSIGILVATIVLLGVLGARVYKGGVLMYGASNSLKDFKKALSLSKKE
ncbi:ABC transporter permease [Virgibacillus sp. W0181]|uniref:ABC transporter permease n=1 Tax=Virgibacillus sp. W0181 TaxID=3391581 RepID=UPI003F487534